MRRSLSLLPPPFWLACDFAESTIDLRLPFRGISIQSEQIYAYQDYHDTSYDCRKHGTPPFHCQDFWLFLFSGLS
jgi:hypothetical protein